MNEKHNRNLLVIGGSGGLSGVVARKALESGRVWTVTRGQREVPEGVIPIHADRNDAEVLKKLLKAQNVKWDAVIDCICMNREHAEEDLNILPEFTDRLVAVSTDSVYDGRFKRIPENEDGITVDEPGETAECTYAGNKRHMEEVFLREMKAEKPRLNITIFRPGHIYGPGFIPGCFPEHSRQRELTDLIRRGESIRLVGMGTYVIHPIYVDDLADALLDCIDKGKCFGEIFCIGGPEALENKDYYKCIADILGVKLNLHEIPLEGYLEAHPEYSGHLCHRVYDLSKLKAAGVKLPGTKLRDGMEKMLRSLGKI